MAVQLQANGCGQQVCNSFDSASIQLNFNMEIPAILDEIFSPKVCISFNLPQIQHTLPGVQRQVLFKQFHLRPGLQEGWLHCAVGGAGHRQVLETGAPGSISVCHSHGVVLGTKPLCLFFYIFEMSIIVSTSKGGFEGYLIKLKSLIHIKH